MPAILLDTSVAIPLRDGDPAVLSRAGALGNAPYLSVLTVAELEGGVFVNPAVSEKRRAALDAMLAQVDVLAFGATELAAYRAILTARGFVRAKVLDRLIAATALAHGLALATRNPKDFRDIPGLAQEEW